MAAVAELFLQRAPHLQLGSGVALAPWIQPMSDNPLSVQSALAATRHSTCRGRRLALGLVLGLVCESSLTFRLASSGASFTLYQVGASSTLYLIGESSVEPLSKMPSVFVEFRSLSLSDSCVLYYVIVVL